MKRSTKTLITFGSLSLACLVVIAIILWQVL